jgi:cation-transporting ATPase E
MGNESSTLNTGNSGEYGQESTIRGLTSEEAAQRARRGLINVRSQNGTKSVKEIILSNLLTYFNMVFLILGALLIVAGSYHDLSFILVLMANAAIGIVQELSSKKVLDRLTLVNAPKVVVYRDRRRLKIDSAELVPDDCIELSGGIQIPADCIVLHGTVHVNESMLTGEADEIEKKRGDVLSGGSFVTNGSCYAKVTHVGDDTYASKLTLEATRMQGGEESQMLRDLDRILKFVGVLIIPIGIILFVQQYAYSHSGFSSSITGMVAALIGMIPEGIYLLTSVALAVSAARLAKQKVLVHDLKCIETLARVDVLCVDKTGTITEKEMQLKAIEPLSESMTADSVEDALCSFAYAMPDANDTLKAIQNCYEVRHAVRAEEVVPFSSRYKYSAATIYGKNYVLGAPEFVLGNEIEKYRDIIDRYSLAGCRVLAFSVYPVLPHGEPLSGGGMPLAVIALENPIRHGAKDTFRYFEEQGVSVKVISGDNPATVSAVARRAGIKDPDRYIDASTLKSRADIAEAAGEYTVFGRVTPEQKKMLVAAMQSGGHTVAMTGDGVNDIIAMKKADCSVAMASGSDAASQAAQLVLLDSDFTRMPSIVSEGRRVVNNIQRSAVLYLVKNIFSLLLAIFSVILMLDYPLVPSQITLISFFNIGIPTFFLALEPNEERIRGRFMTNVVIQALPAAITDFVAVSGLVLFCREFGITADCMSTSVSILVACIGFMILYRIMRPMKKEHVMILVGCIIGWLIGMFRFGSFFGITELSKQCAMLMGVFAIAADTVLHYLSRLSKIIHTDYLRKCENAAGRSRKKR